MKPDEQLWQENQQLREQIIVLEAWVKTLQSQLMDRPPAMQRSLVFRQCAHPDCDISALVDRDTPEERLCYCVVHARGCDHEDEP